MSASPQTQIYKQVPRLWSLLTPNSQEADT